MIKKILLLLTGLFVITAQAYADDAVIDVVHDKAGIYVFKMDTKKMGDKIKPHVSEYLTTTSDVYKNNDNFQLVVNGGFFDPVTGAAVSYVTIDGNPVETPFTNMGLILNAGKENRLEGILNRAELRIIENKRGELVFDIANHFAPVPKGYKIKHSLQAGPLIYPEFDLEKECFIKKQNDKVIFEAADVLKKRERTIVALKDKFLYVIIFTNQNKVTLSDIVDYCKANKFDKAMAFDGGTSTSVNYDKIEIYSKITSQRKVKSFLVVEK